MTQLDLSTLPPPKVVEELSFEAILSELRADMIQRLPEIEPTLALESSVVSKLLQNFAYRETLLRSRANDAALSLLLARATGADLDNVAANFGVARLVVAPAAPPDTPAVMESDDRLRRRVLLAIEAYSVAGPAGAYEYHALTTIPSLRDAKATSPEPGRVVVTIMASREEPVPSVEDRAKVALALSDRTVRPLTDAVSVAAPNVIDVSIEAVLTIYPGPDGGIVAQNARDRLAAWLEEVAFLGRDLRRSAIISRLHVEGVQSVDLITPAADVIAGKRDAIKVASTDVTISGVDE
jgi:phage-related baseplate assembly protein